jgi:uncharacterized membrane-anchored protein
MNRSSANRVNGLQFVLAFIAMMTTVAATFIANRFLFADQREMETLIILAWSAAFVIILYRMFRTALDSQPLSLRERQQYMFNAMIFVIELVAVCTMVIIAVVVVSTLTSPDVENTSLPLVTTIIGLIALSIRQVAPICVSRNSSKCVKPCAISTAVGTQPNTSAVN